MEKKDEIKIGRNGTEYKKTTIINTPEDGFVPQSELRPFDKDSYGKYHYGYAKNVSYSTDNPKVIGAFVFPFIAIFIIIGIFLCINSFASGNLATIGFGVFFLGFSVFSLFIFIKEFKEIRKKYDEKHKNDK